MPVRRSSYGTARQNTVADKNSAFDALIDTLKWPGHDAGLLRQKADLDSIIESYCDFGGHLHSLLSLGHHYIKGRRGTGKSALMVRACAECVLSWDEAYLERSARERALKQERVLGVYIDLAAAKRLVEHSSSSIELCFVETLLEEIETQLSDVWQPRGSQSKEFFGRTFNNLRRQGRIDKKREQALENFKQAVADLREWQFHPTEQIHTKQLDSDVDISFGATVSTNPEIFGGFSRGRSGTEVSYVGHLIPPTAADILRRLEFARKQADISAIYVFLDEFSNVGELAEKEEIENLQTRLSRILKTLLRSGSIFFKISVISDRYTLGALEPQHDVSEISLDISNVFENATDFASGMRTLTRKTYTILQKRLEVFAPGIHLEDLFAMDIDEAVSLLTLESMGNPRTIGRILEYAQEDPVEVPVDEQSLRSGIHKDHIRWERIYKGLARAGVYDEFYEFLWSEIVDYSKHLRNTYNDIPVSLFLAHSRFEDFLRPLRENYLVHLIQEDFTLPGTRLAQHSLYMFDYDACSSFTEYGLPQSQDSTLWKHFIYDSLMDQYAAGESDTLYRCQNCGQFYATSQFPPEVDFNRCMSCGGALGLLPTKAKGRLGIDSEFSDTEIQIVQFVFMTSGDGYLPRAVEIAQNVDGCTYQKAAWFAKKYPHFVGRVKPMGASRRLPYRYYDATQPRLAEGYRL